MQIKSISYDNSIDTNRKKRYNKSMKNGTETSKIKQQKGEKKTMKTYTYNDRTFEENYILIYSPGSFSDIRYDKILFYIKNDGSVHELFTDIFMDWGSHMFISLETFKILVNRVETALTNPVPIRSILSDSIGIYRLNKKLLEIKMIQQNLQSIGCYDYGMVLPTATTEENLKDLYHEITGKYLIYENGWIESDKNLNEVGEF